MFLQEKSKSNGRVDTLADNNYEMYKLFHETKPYNNAEGESLRSIHEKNELSDLFFSRQNIDYIGADDPAKYNNGVINNNGNFWAEDKVGKIWWDFILGVLIYLI